MGIQRAKAARIQAYRELLLDVGERIFAERGFEGARMTEIAEATELSVGTIYGVFAGKSELFSAVITHRLPGILKAANEAAAKAATPMHSLLLGMDAYIGFMLAHPNFLRIHLREHPWGLGPSRGASEQLFAWRNGLDFQAKVLQQAMRDGEVIECDATLLARSISALHQVHLNAWVEDGMREDPVVVRRRLAKLFVAFFCTASAQHHVPEIQ